jgi:hypothetical protein
MAGGTRPPLSTQAGRRRTDLAIQKPQIIGGGMLAVLRLLWAPQPALPRIKVGHLPEFGSNCFERRRLAPSAEPGAVRYGLPA